jgi:superfamily I DNA/RNA helicase
MLDVFLKQRAVKIIVGDMHQQIYGWRYAINSLQQVNFPVYNLTHSFRFDEEVALVANKILAWKQMLHQPPAVKIIGAGKPSEIVATKATLGRTNVSLLLNAISQWQHGGLSKLFFEGNIHSYTFADEGASLYDVLHLYNGKTDKIKDKLIAEMKSMKELEEYIQKTEDNSLSIIVDVVKEFGNRLPGLIADLKKNHTTTKEEADMIFSTVHRCKGMEYDEVTLLSDFITAVKLEKHIAENGGDEMNAANRNRLAEEVNILYVAATRAKSKLLIPPEINPLKSIGLAPAVVPIAIPRYEKSFKADWDLYDRTFLEKRNPYQKIINHGKKWSEEDESTLVEMFQQGRSAMEIAKKIGRGEKGVKIKLMSLGLMENGDVE